MVRKKSEDIFNDFLAKAGNSNWRENNTFREENKEWLRKSAKIAIKITRELRAKKITQISLAKKLNVSPQQVNKILKGRENLTLETVSKIEIALGIELISILANDDIVIKKAMDSLISVASEILKLKYTKPHRRSRKISHIVTSSNVISTTLPSPVKFDSTVTRKEVKESKKQYAIAA